MQELTIREQTEQIEHNILSPYAALSCQTCGRERFESPCEIRTEYQRDRDRIIHCKSFRRLKHKTQVFLAPEGDHYRTRLTHTLEVSQIARTIARALRLNEDLTEAVALAHDLGHTPFGHAGERVLNEICSGGFCHYEQSVRVVEKLENDGKGLNLTWEVRNGILCHTKGSNAKTLEGQIVRWADRIAYINHDIDDALRAGVLQQKDIPGEILHTVGNTRTERINCMVLSLVRNSQNGKLQMAPDIKEAFDCLHEFMYQTVYQNSIAKAEEAKIPRLITTLYEFLRQNPQYLSKQAQMIAEKEGIDRAVCDYIAGMTDQYAVYTFERFFVPRAWGI